MMEAAFSDADEILHERFLTPRCGVRNDKVPVALSGPGICQREILRDPQDV
jgi:hypothetical protein